MRALMFLWLILSCANSFAQIDVGTKWTYTKVDAIGDYVHEPTSIEAVKDTTIDNQAWKILNGIKGCANSFKNAAIREDGSKVYLVDIITNEETILYDYSLIAGDSYQVQIFGSGFAYDINIDSTKILSFNGKDYKVQFIDNIEFGQYIIEGIGSNNYLVPQGNICDPHFFGLRCFSSGNDFVDFDLNHECDEVIVLNNSNDLSRNRQIEIYPNPFSEGNLTLENETGESIKQVEIINSNGQVVKIFSALAQGNQINLGGLSKGLYVIRIHLGKETTSRKLILK